MRFPSKVTPYSESILPLAGKLIERIPPQGLSVLELFVLSKNLGGCTSDFFQILDFLFMIGKIKLNENKEICYAD